MAMFSAPRVWLVCLIFSASPSAEATEFFRIRSAVAPQKCIGATDRRFLLLRECSTDHTHPHEVWSFNKTWLVNLKQLDLDGDGTLQTMCVGFDRTYYYHHGRPLRVQVCQEGHPNMDWVWEDGRIRHVHTGYVFDLPGHNIPDLDGKRNEPDHQPSNFGWYGFPEVQLGAQDSSTSSDQVFMKEIMTSLGNLTQPFFEPLPATEVLPDYPREQSPMCPDGSFGERNVCPRVRRRSRTDLLCRGGTLTYKCVCFPGYSPLVVGITPPGNDLGYLDYTCCRGEGTGDSEECGDHAIWLPLAVALTVLGACGLLTTSLMIYRNRPRIAPATEEDLQVLVPQCVHDGAVLHRTVEQAKWGVSLDDLWQFKRLVHHAVRSGDIRPTDRDQFSASDVVRGPSAYTVDSQMIQPVTAAAGNVSWALMKHPEGLPCDLFVTHGWAEGIFDFVEKVANSWPRSAQGAYICFLSNPQNLDIADLIQKPRESPFAIALGASSSMLVVSNHVSSIYTRAWCVYEAFLADSWDKPIRLAKRPLLNEWPRILRVFSTGITAFGGGMLFPIGRVNWYGLSYDSWSLMWELQWAFTYLGLLLGAFIGLAFYCCFGRFAGTIQFAIHAMTAVLALSVPINMTWVGLKDVPTLFRLSAIVVGTAALEADRQRALIAMQQRNELSKDFAGSVKQAQSSSPEDLERILDEIEEHDQADAIDRMVASLMAMNVSTKQIRLLMKVTGNLRDMSRWSRGAFCLTVIFLLFQVRQMYRYRIPEAGMVMGWLLTVCAGLQAMLWPVIFLRLPVESKAFAERCAKLLLLLIPGMIGPWWFGTVFDNYLAHNTFSAIAHFCVIPLFIFMAASGPLRVACVPFIGPGIVRMLFGKIPCTRRRQSPRMAKQKDGD